jgi:enamine deaminase RidA (YjgF/YER057c/UK114 family)
MLGRKLPRRAQDEAKFNDVYKTYFGADYPARAFVGSGALVRLARFEVNAIAVKRW